MDELGYVKAQIADLEAKEAELRQSLIDSGFKAAEGEFFRCTVSTVEWERVSYREIVEALPKTPQLTRLTKANTHKEKKTVVKVVSR